MECLGMAWEGEGGINVFAIAEIYNSSLWFVEKYLSIQSDHLPCNVHLEVFACGSQGGDVATEA
ncbi:hypothetical protein BHU11_03840 [Tannerella sp. oral taxon 808]|nr:hypothetical protein BHU11_03840 [Tannerella sp. oral taxon 808]